MIMLLLAGLACLALLGFELTRARTVVVSPIDRDADFELRYDDWEYTRRLDVDRASQNKIGYQPSWRCWTSLVGHLGDRLPRHSAAVLR